MKRGFAVICGLMLTISLAACGAEGEPSSAVSPAVSSPLEIENGGQPDAGRRIQITSENGSVIVFVLNRFRWLQRRFTTAPLYAEAENYSNNEKIWYPPEKLDTGDAPLAKGPAGTLAYYAPWGNVAIFYGDCAGASGLYALGTAISGTASIAELTGSIRVETAGTPASSGLSESSRPTQGFRRGLAGNGRHTAADSAFVRIRIHGPDRIRPETGHTGDHRRQRFLRLLV